MQCKLWVPFTGKWPMLFVAQGDQDVVWNDVLAGGMPFESFVIYNNLHEISINLHVILKILEPPLCATQKCHLTLPPPGSGVQRRSCSSCMSSEARAGSLPRRATLTACNSIISSTRHLGFLGKSFKSFKISGRFWDAQKFSDRLEMLKWPPRDMAHTPILFHGSLNVISSRPITAIPSTIGRFHLHWIFYRLQELCAHSPLGTSFLNPNCPRKWDPRIHGNGDMQDFKEIKTSSQSVHQEKHREVYTYFNRTMYFFFALESSTESSRWTSLRTL